MDVDGDVRFLAALRVEPQQIDELLRAGKISAALVIPPDFERRLATHDRVYDLPLQSGSSAGFLVDFGEPRETWDVLGGTPESLELWSMPASGSLRGFDERGEPQTFEPFLPTRQVEEIAGMQRGVLHCADLWPHGARERGAHFTYRNEEVLRGRLRAIAVRSVDDPTVEEARLFEHWEHDSNDGSLDHDGLFGNAVGRERAGFMSYEQVRAMSGSETFWPAGLAALVGKIPKRTSPLVERALRLGLVRAGSDLVARSAVAISRLFGGK